MVTSCSDGAWLTHPNRNLSAKKAAEKVLQRHEEAEKQTIEAASTVKVSAGSRLPSAQSPTHLLMNVVDTPRPHPETRVTWGTM